MEVGPETCAWGVVSGLSALQLLWHVRARQMVLQNAEEEAVAQSLSRPRSKPACNWNGVERVRAEATCCNFGDCLLLAMQVHGLVLQCED